MNYSQFHDAVTYEKLYEKYGNSYYLYNKKIFSRNYKNLINKIRNFYPKAEIAYSYKTNYLPEICRTVSELGGYAEVVSSMEYYLARVVEKNPRKIFLNGPFKDPQTIRKMINDGGIINIDSWDDYRKLKDILISAETYKIKLGIRCNFNVNGELSRFGVDGESDDLVKLLDQIHRDGFRLSTIQCHFQKRDKNTWEKTMEKMINFYFLFTEKYGYSPENVSVGGGLSGPMPKEMKTEFSYEIPTFDEYAKIIGGNFASAMLQEKNKPLLFIEPGTSLVGDTFEYIVKVVSVKQISNQKYITVDGSTKNISAHSERVKVPLKVIRDKKFLNPRKELVKNSVVGYTCLERDIICDDFNYDVRAGDLIVFTMAGAYSITMKPPFILPNTEILSVDRFGDEKILKQKETPEYIFKTYK